MTGLLSSELSSFLLLLGTYYSELPQIEEHLGYEFETKPSIGRSYETPYGREEEWNASYWYTLDHINIRPDAENQDLVYLIGHELGHHHFKELGHWSEWQENQEWGEFLSEVYAEWTGCSYTGTCTYYQTGGADKHTFKPGDIPRPTFFLSMQELFEEGKLEEMMNNPTTIPPPNEWYERMK